MKKTSNTEKTICTETLKLLGDFWTLNIINILRNKELRYCGIERALENAQIAINPVTLTNRLQKLEQSGLIIRKEETIDKLSVSYMLTAKGKAALPVLKALDTFSKKVQ